VKIGFAVPQKENERRRALLPPQLAQISQVGSLVFETGYGEVMGYDDRAYRQCGCIVAERAEVCACPIICDPKPVLTNEYFRAGKTLFGWIHAVQGRQMTDVLVDNRMTAIAWEDMFENGRHTFWRNNEISGEAAIAHAFLQWGRPPYCARAAVIGRGNVARGALRALERGGCSATVYDRKTSPALRDEVDRYDVVVNAVLWDVFRTDHLLYEDDLGKMKPGSLIVDISCDPDMGIQSSHPTSIQDPVYWHKGVLHYAVDHTPVLYYKTASASISKAVTGHVNDLVEGNRTPALDNATIIRNGRILHNEIRRFQKRVKDR